MNRRWWIFVSSLMIAILLFCGAILLDVRPFGRNYPQTHATYQPTPPEAVHFIAEQTRKASPPKAYVNEACLQCICEAITECKPSICYVDKPCGVFRISEPYWIDGGALQVEGDNSKKQNRKEGYDQCINNAHCAARTVAGFVGRHAKDCNHDGVIDCRDHVELHILGPTGCLIEELEPVMKARMEMCLARFN